MNKYLPNLIKSDSRISELVLGGSRGDSAFMRVNIPDDFGIHKGISNLKSEGESFGLGCSSHPQTTQLEVPKLTKRTSLTEEIKKKQDTENIKQGQQSTVANYLKDVYFNKQSTRARKRRRAEDE